MRDRNEQRESAVTSEEMELEALRITADLAAAGVGSETARTLDGALQVEDDGGGCPCFYVLIERDGSASGAVLDGPDLRAGMGFETGDVRTFGPGHPFFAALADQRAGPVAGS
ncbi:MAG: hypothetical protein DI629_20145 [Mesorhizobium amorphae]|nr:MAG: hypothetical protein DI629_20145 [Mesorhizobium amorphae]